MPNDKLESGVAEVEFIPFNASLANDFKRINEEWITQMFVMEDADRAALDDPFNHIIAPGGQIWFAKVPKLGIVGTCALLRQGEGVFELTKMGVLDSVRGLKVGELLLQKVIAAAAEVGAEYLFLLTNRKCESAIHLYQKNGFVHDKQVMEAFGAEYERCNVAMRYRGCV